MRKLCLPAIADEKTRVIVLGSMPGDESLRQQRYYANPRNQFWEIIDSMFRRSVISDYDAHVAFLRDVGIGLWDVLHRCERSGSADANIQNGEANDFTDLFRACPHLKCLAFNGGKAQSAFAGAATVTPPDVDLIALPSSSGALARPLEEKVKSWRRVLSFLK